MNTDNLLNEGFLYVGWSEKSITPDKPVKLQDQFFERISEYVQSPIIVTVLALETRDSYGNVLEQMMIGACDLTAVTKNILDEVRMRLQVKLEGFELSKLFINATHTHTSPLTDEVITTASHINEIYF